MGWDGMFQCSFVYKNACRKQQVQVIMFSSFVGEIEGLSPNFNRF